MTIIMQQNSKDAVTYENAQKQTHTNRYWCSGGWWSKREAAPALCDAANSTRKLVVVRDDHSVVVGSHPVQGVPVHLTLPVNSNANDPDTLTFDAVCCVGELLARLNLISNNYGDHRRVWSYDVAMKHPGA